jgi:hypothetical protein
MEEEKAAKIGRRERESIRLTDRVEAYQSAITKLFHCFWGYPVIPDEDNPYFRYLKDRKRRVFLNGITEEMVKSQTAELIVTKIGFRTSADRKKRMNMRADIARYSSESLFSAREGLRQFWIDAEFADLKTRTASHIDYIDASIDRLRIAVERMQPQYWAVPIYPDLNLDALDWQLEKLHYFDEDH